MTFPESSKATTNKRRQKTIFSIQKPPKVLVFGGRTILFTPKTQLPCPVHPAVAAGRPSHTQHLPPDSDGLSSFSFCTQQCSPAPPPAQGLKGPPFRLFAPGSPPDPPSLLRPRLALPPLLPPRRPSPLCLRPSPPPAQTRRPCRPRPMSPSPRRMSPSLSAFVPSGTLLSPIGPSPTAMVLSFHVFDKKVLIFFVELCIFTNFDFRFVQCSGD